MNWRDVSEQPDCDGEYLIVIGNAEIAIGIFISGMWKKKHTQSALAPAVSHWMKLPPLP